MKEDTTRDLLSKPHFNCLINKATIKPQYKTTRLPKGAIYRRFENKNEIAIASFNHSMEIIWKQCNLKLQLQIN